MNHRFPVTTIPMNIIVLSQIYQSAKSNLAKIKLLSTYNSHLYKDFPKNIPKKVDQAIQTDFADVFFGLGGPGKAVLKNKPELQDKLYSVGLVHAQNRFDEIGKAANKGFEQNIFQQEWISYFAYVEAFFQDICRFIYTANPQLLSSGKQITWESVIAAGSYENLIDKLIESALESSGYNNLAKLIEQLNRPPCLLKIRIDKERLLYLRWSIATRNAIIHNNSKVTKDLFELTTEMSELKQTESKPEPVGAIIELEGISTSGVYLFLDEVIDTVYEAVMEKYFPDFGNNA